MRAGTRTKQTSYKHDDRASEDFTPLMIRSLEGLQRVAKVFEVDIVPYTALSLQKFRALGPDDQLRRLKSVEIWRAAYEEALQASANVINFEGIDAVALRAAALKYGFVIHEDFYKLIRQGDVVEIYTFHGMNQEWRNFEFMRLCSYDVLTLLLNPMNELFFRDESAGEVLLARLKELVDDPRPRPCPVPQHTICEKIDPRNRRFQIAHKMYAGVSIIDGPVIGVVATLRASPMGSLHDEAPNVRPLWS